MKSKLIHILLLSVLIGGLFIRVYRTDQILGFYFDQGRDALVIWNFWHKGKFFLVGPTTGIAGIFRGPFYYYLIAPFYLFGHGDPIWPAVFLAIISMFAILLLYFLGAKIYSEEAGLFASILAAFSFNLLMASRWLSNPTPMLVLSVVLVWLMLLIADGKKWAWPALAFVAALSLFHFGSSGELFYFLAIAIFAVWQRKNLPNRIQIFWSFILFAITVMPQIIFDLRHGGILRKNIYDFLVADKSFEISFWQVVVERINFYYDVFSNKIFHWRRIREIWLLRIWGMSFLLLLPRLVKNKGVKILLLLLFSPILGLLFFQGNFGNIYDYYLTGYYLIFVLLFAIVLAAVWKNLLGKVFVLAFFWVFLTWNGEVIRYRISAGVDGPRTVVFGNQKQAINWIYENAGGENFNVDVYVPPVIPYAYDYLFLWLGSTKYRYLPEEENVELLYTLYEVDPPHPERLEAWLDRQKEIGEVEEEARFGGITVQRRKRI